MQVKVRRQNDNISLQGYLEESEKKWSWVINLLWRNSINKNRSLRKKAKYINIITWFRSIFTVGSLAIIAIMIVWNFMSFNFKIESMKVDLLGEVNALYEDVQIPVAMQQEQFWTSEADEFIEEISEIYSDPEITSDYFEKLFAYIAMSEGSFQAEAFCDSYYKTATKLIRKSPDDCTRWSIGYGTISFRWEVITYEEGIKRKQEDIRARDALITSTCLTENQRIAVIDFMYQHWNYASNVKYNANSCNTNYIFWKFAAWRDQYRAAKKYWMERREQLRINKFYQ